MFGRRRSKTSALTATAGAATPAGTPISDERAIELARAAIAGKVTPSGGPIVVTRRNDEVVVEFRRDDPPGTRGPDYDAQVVLHSSTGAVRSVLGGG